MLSQSVPSAALVAANERLQQLRKAYRDADQTPAQGVQSTSFAAPIEKRKAVFGETNPLIGGQLLPSHLGWGSAPLTAALRSCHAPALHFPDAVEQGTTRLLPAKPDEPGLIQTESKPGAEPSEASRLPDQNHAAAWVKLYPDIGLAMLRQELAAPGRLWLVLRYLDAAGRGTLDLDDITTTLTQKSTLTYLCGKRQLRNLLRAGEGLFWTRANGRIWLRAVAKVAAGLGVTRLSGKPVALPASVLFAGIGAFRAHLYAAFHSGRVQETPQGRQAMPLARQTLARLSGVGASSQRSYEVRTGLSVRPNFAIGRVATDENLEESAWQQGQARFTLQDYRGQQGQPGKRYLAWQLPNSYGSIHPCWPKGRQRRINRELKDLVTQGTPGNGGETMAARSPRQPRRYYALARQAVQVANRQPDRLGYWPQPGRREGSGRFTLWQQAGGG